MSQGLLASIVAPRKFACSNAPENVGKCQLASMNIFFSWPNFTLKRNKSLNLISSNFEDLGQKRKAYANFYFLVLHACKLPSEAKQSHVSTPRKKTPCSRCGLHGIHSGSNSNISLSRTVICTLSPQWESESEKLNSYNSCQDWKRYKLAA